MREYDISIIVTVYNKAQFLPSTIKSLLAQQDTKKLLKMEFVFVDDASTDDSVAVIRRMTKGLDNVVMIENQENVGPSIRVNQAVKHSNGQYLHFIDGDDIMPKGCSETLYNLLKKENADVVYGKFKKTQLEAEDLLGYKMLQNGLSYHASNSPLKFVMSGGFVRMTLMVKRNVFTSAKGCDEKIFIQDESLPLRLAAAAKRFIKLNDIIVYVPRITDTNLSTNKAQKNHDRFLAYYNFWHEHNITDIYVEKAIFQKLISCYWKFVRDIKKFPYFSKSFLYYLYAKLFQPRFNEKIVVSIYEEFHKVSGIRRPDSV